MRDTTLLILPDVREYLRAGQVEALREELEEFQPADVADLLAHLDAEEESRLFTALPMPQRVRVFEEMPEDAQLALVERLGREAMARVVDAMAPDERADLVKALPTRTRDTLLPLLAQAERQDVARLTAFAEGTTGALMTTEYAAQRADQSVGELLDHLREVAPDRETIYYVFLVDPERHLQGVVSLRQLVLARREHRVADIMTSDVISVRASDPAEVVARVVERYDFLAVPVVDDGGRLVGIVTHDDALDVLQAAATADAHRMAAVAPLEAPYTRLPFVTIARKRGGWLALLFLAEMGTAAALGTFEATIQHSVLLVFFLPLIISQGGNSGSQTATLVTRALALGELGASTMLRVLAREAALGLLLGGAIGLLGLGVAAAWGPGAAVTAVVGLAIVLVVLIGSVLGSCLPILLRRLGIDPAYASSPLVACLMDILGVTLYFGLATLVL